MIYVVLEMFVKQQEGGMISCANILLLVLDRVTLVAVTEHSLQHMKRTKIPGLALETVCSNYELI